MAKVEKRFEKYKPLQKKNLRILKLVVRRQKQGDFSGKHHELFFETRCFEKQQDKGGRGKAALRRRVDTCVNTRSRITRTQQVLDFYVHPSPCSSIS